jgi:hypothetical protein
MAALVDLLTLGEIQVLALDSNPSTGGGYAAIIGSYATINNQGSPVGAMYLKTGSGNTAWDQLVTYSSGTNVGLGSILQVPVYDLSPNGYHLNPTVLQNGQTLGMAYRASPTRTAPITYTIPNPGDAVTAADFVLTQGNQTIAGIKTFSNDVYVNGNMSVLGTLTYLATTVDDVTAKFINLNMGGPAASGAGVGFQVSEGATTASVNGATNATAVFAATHIGTNGNDKTVQITNSGSGGFRLVSDNGSAVVVDLGGAGAQNAAAFNALAGLDTLTMTAGTISAAEGPLTLAGGNDGITGSFLVSADRKGYTFLAPAIASSATLTNTLLTGNRTMQVPDASGTIVEQSTTAAGANTQVAFWTGTYLISNPTGVAANSLTWLNASNFFGIQQATPKSILHVGNNTTSGTVGAGAIILGVLNGTANVAAGALIANGSGGANTASGTDSAVFGASNVASGTASLAAGTGNTASNTNTVAVGSSTTASGAQAMASGASTTASGTNSWAGGNSSTATATAAFAFGTSCIADGANSRAHGVKAQAGGFAGVFIATDSQNFQTTSTQADHMKLRFANGLKLVAGGGADNVDGVNWQRNMASASTTDATVTTAQTIAIPNNSEVLIQTQVLARKTGGAGTGTTNDGGTYIRTARFKNNGGTVTMFNLQSDYTSEDVAGFNVTMSASGTNAIIQVTGAANDNITWFVISDTYVNS